MKKVLHYSLIEIASFLWLEPGTNISDCVAAHCMTAICESFDPNYIIESNKELEGMNHYALRYQHQIDQDNFPHSTYVASDSWGH